MTNPNITNINQALDEAWQAACDVEHGRVREDSAIQMLLAIAIQDVVLAIREIIEPEESP